MQPLLDGPRAGLPLTTVTDLLQGTNNLRVGYGARRLDRNMNIQEDLTPFMSAGSSITSDSTASIHRTCTLTLDSNNPVVYGTDFVQPWMDLTNPDTGATARFYLGVYTLATPSFDNSKLPSALSVTGYDLLYYLNDVIGDSIQIPAGSDPIVQATNLILAAFPGAQIQAIDTTTTLTSALTFPFDSSNNSTSYLEVINTLLAAVGYQPVWVDWNGTFQLVPYVTPTNTNAEWTFDLTAEDNIVAEPRTSTQDLFSVPNYWIFIMENLTAAPVEGTTQFSYIDASPNNPASLPNRGRIKRKITFVSTADFASLVQFGLSVIAQDITPAETFDITTSPFPLAWQYDQILYIDSNLASVPPALQGVRRVQATQWSLPLDGGDMTWTWQTVAT